MRNEIKKYAEQLMKDFDPSTSFGPSVAARYDDQLRGDEEAAATFLQGFVKEAGALEFAIGTGRVALPLANRDVKVEGIELSPHMVERLCAKPGGKDIPVVIGDMSRTTTGNRYDVVYLVYNTIFNLLTADDQVRCFENAARHLTDDGVFVVEAALPQAWVDPKMPRYVHAENVGVDSVTLDVARYDSVTQLLEENHLTLSASGIRLSPIVCRLITPGEMDLMARIAGMFLVERVADWQRTPFDDNSRAHVSVYALNERRT